MRGVRSRRAALVAWMVIAAGLAGCRFTRFDIETTERFVRVPESTRRRFVVATGPIELPASFGSDKTIDSATLILNAKNLNLVNPVDVSISVASSRRPNDFGEIATFSLDAGGEIDLVIVQDEAGDPLVVATQSDVINIEFDSRSPDPGIGAIEFRFTVRVKAHKDTPGTGPGTLLFF